MTEYQSSIIRSQRLFVRAFWILLAATVAFHLGAQAARGPYNHSCGQMWTVPSGFSGFFILLTIVNGVIVLVNFLMLGKTRNQKQAASKKFESGKE